MYRKKSADLQDVAVRIPGRKTISVYLEKHLYHIQVFHGTIACMRLIGNIIWLIFGGLFGAVGWVLAGILVSATIVGIPFGIQCFKIAGFVLWPFGKEILLGDFGIGSVIGNVIWILLLGWELALFHAGVALLFFVSIIGIPFAFQHLKFAQLAFVPFGSRIIR